MGDTEDTATPTSADAAEELSTVAPSPEPAPPDQPGSDGDGDGGIKPANTYEV